MSTRNWLVKFTNVDESECDSIIKVIRHPSIKDAVNDKQNLECDVISLFYWKTRDGHLTENMRVIHENIFSQYFLSLIIVFFICRNVKKAYIQLIQHANFRDVCLISDCVNERKIGELGD